MGQVYWKEGLPEATFSLFFRSNNKRSYFVFSGINDVLEQIRNFSFDDEYLTYLDSLKLFEKTKSPPNTGLLNDLAISNTPL